MTHQRILENSVGAESLAEIKTIIQKDVIVAKEEAVIVANRNGKMGNWLFDFRHIFLNAKTLQKLAEVFWTIFKEDYPFQVGGMESASIPLVTAIVLTGQARGTPINGFYIRKSRKKIGLMKHIEGSLGDEKVILVDDLINSGGSFIKQIEVLNSLNRKIASVFAFVRFRNDNAYTYFQNKNIDVVTLFALTDFGLNYYPPAPPDPFYFKKIWQFQGGKPNFYKVEKKSTPALDAEKIYFGTDQGTVFALNQETGGVVWKFQVGIRPRGSQIISDIILHEKALFFASYNGNVISLDTTNGKINWIFSDADWVGSSPALSPKNNTLYVGLNRGWFHRKKNFIYALDMKSGKLKWRGEITSFIRGNIAVTPDEEMIITGGVDGDIFVFRKDGGRAWQAKVDGAIHGSFVFEDTGQYAYFGTTKGALYKITSKTGLVEKKFRADAHMMTTPVIHKGKIIFTSLDKSVYCLDIMTSKELWRFRTMGRVFAAPTIWNDLVLVGSNDARLYALDSLTGKAVGFFQVPERITNKVIYNFETAKFFLTTFANELYCLSKSK